MKIIGLLRKLWLRIRYGKITSHTVDTAGYGVASEIEYRDCKNNVIGFWAYGYWHPDYPYQGK